MKRLYPQNYPVLLLTIGTLYGFMGYLTIVKAQQYYALPAFLFCAILILNKRIYLGSEKVYIMQGFTIIILRYADIESLSIRKARPKLSRYSAPAICIVTSNGRKKFLNYYRMYSKKSLSEFIHTLLIKNSNTGLSNSVKELMNY